MPQLITINSEILGGAPVISGTRVPVERLKFLVESGYSPLDLKEEYPQISIKKLLAVMAYLIGKGINAVEEEHKETPR